MSTTISLDKMEFFAYHGFTDEEQKIGNKYEVSLSISLDYTEASQNDQLSDTVDYAELYQVVKAQMAVKSRLLEHIAAQIVKIIMNQFPIIQDVEIIVSKMNPPIGGICQKASIKYHESRS